MCSEDEWRPYGFGTTWGWVWQNFHFWVSCPFKWKFCYTCQILVKSTELLVELVHKSELVHHFSWGDSGLCDWFQAVFVLSSSFYPKELFWRPTGAILFNYTLLSSFSHVCGIREVSCVSVVPIVHGLQQVRQDHVAKQQNAGHRCPYLDFRRHTTCRNTCAISQDVCVCVCVWEDLYFLSSFLRQKFSWITFWSASQRAVYLVKHSGQHVGAMPVFTVSISMVMYECVKMCLCGKDVDKWTALSLSRLTVSVGFQRLFLFDLMRSGGRSQLLRCKRSLRLPSCIIWQLGPPHISFCTLK